MIMTLTAPGASDLLTGAIFGSSLGGIVFYVWIALALSRLFRKCGIDGWKAWVPFLNVYELLQLGGFNGWLVLLVLIPGLGALAVAVLVVISAHRINHSFGFGAGMTVLAALLFPVWASVLGFGSARWLGREAGSVGGPARADYGMFGSVTPLPASAPQFGGARPQVSAPGPLAPVPPVPSMPPLPTSMPPRPPLPSVPTAPVADVPAWAPPRPAPEEQAPRPAPEEQEPLLPPAPPVLPPTPPVVFDAPARRPVDPEDLEGVDDPVFDFGDENDLPPAGPRRSSQADQDDDQAAAVTRVPAAPRAAASEPWAPRSETEGFPESSGEVSAVVGSPDAGEPRSALASISAQHARPQIPEDAEEFDETVVTRRKRTEWVLIPPSGRSIELTSDVVILGRRPSFDPDHPTAQLVAVDDDTRTISKTHARLELRDERWHVTDLESTNGVLLTTVLGTEVEASPDAELAVGERFLLGDAELRLERSPE